MGETEVTWLPLKNLLAALATSFCDKRG